MVLFHDISLGTIRLHIERSFHDELKIRTWDDSLKRAVEDSLIRGASLG